MKPSGVFDRKLKEECKNNGLSEINYKLEPNTAKNFQKTLCGVTTANKNSTSFTPILSKHYKDSMKKKRNMSQEDLSEQENIDYTNKKDKKPRKIIINTQRGATALPKEDQQKNNNAVKNIINENTPEEIYLNLKKELENNYLLIVSENNIG